MSPPSRLLYVVDGDADARHFQRQRMTYLGWEVRIFPTAAECIPIVLQQIPDCILSDLSAPAMHAVAILNALQAHGLMVPMVALTHRVDALLMRKADAVGINEILDQRCDAGALETALKRAIKNGAREPQDARR